jgi:hypothetical protein
MSATSRVIVVDGKPAVIVGEYVDHETSDLGFDYRFYGERAVHWIKQGSPRLGTKEPACP